MGSKQVVSIVYLIDVDLTKLFHVFEHLVRKADAFARILERFTVILILTQNGAQLQLKFAFLVHAPTPLRNSLALVEFGITYEGNTLLEIENTLFKHANSRPRNKPVVIVAHTLSCIVSNYTYF